MQRAKHACDESQRGLSIDSLRASTTTRVCGSPSVPPSVFGSSGNASRQATPGERGFLYGAIDAQAICARITAGIGAGEFTHANGDVSNVWLAVDPTAELGAVYWAGWSDKVNSFIFRQGGVDMRPFAASILCRYDRVGGRFKRDPRIGAAINAPAFRRGLNTTCFDFWADAVDPDADGVRPAPDLDFGLFDGAEMPAIWRFSTSFCDAAGVAQDESYSLDVVREAVLPQVLIPATSFMLKPAKWQPSVTNVRSVGFSVSDPVTPARVICVQNTPIPQMPDFADEAQPANAARDGHSSIPGQTASVVGKYLRFPPAAGSVTDVEAKRLSDAGISTFVVFERGVNGPVNTAYFQQANRGTDDATSAFDYCGGVLRMPPHAIVYFAVDYDAGDPNPNPAVIAAGGAGGPDAERLVGAYFEQIAAQRDAFLLTNPDRPFEIGVYGPGKVQEWCYSKGIVSGFWQSVSFGAVGNGYGTRPWAHASRWQYQGTFQGHPLPSAWNCINGIDPDVDWGDGGQWNLNDRPALSLTELEDQETAALIRTVLSGIWPGLMP